MKAMIVSVGFDDFLQLSLTRNAKHFSKICVVTTPTEFVEVAAIASKLGLEEKVSVFPTDLFYADGAAFAKWRALEAAWDWFGREGWCCHLDVDILWPWYVEVAESSEDGSLVISSAPTSRDIQTMFVKRGQLFSPLRRMLYRPDFGIPPEKDWEMLPVHRNVNEHAGYCQIFHSSDPVLGPPPWHETDYTHCGCSDSWFQQKWKPENKIRPPWHVLHIGEAGVNWMGRVTPRLDGTKVEGAEERQQQVNRMWTDRRAREAQVRDGTLPKEQLFDAEKVGKNPLELTERKE